MAYSTSAILTNAGIWKPELGVLPAFQYRLVTSCSNSYMTWISISKSQRSLVHLPCVSFGQVAAPPAPCVDFQPQSHCAAPSGHGLRLGVSQHPHGCQTSTRSHRSCKFMERLWKLFCIRVGTVSGESGCFSPSCLLWLTSNEKISITWNGVYICT